MSPELTAEHRRILQAAADGTLRTNENQRWTITGQQRPDRKSREQLKSRGLIDYGTHASSGRIDYRRLVATPKGREAL